MSCTTSIHRRRGLASSRGFAAIVPLAVAVFSSVLLMTACHSPPTQVARASAAAQAPAQAPVAQPVSGNAGHVEAPALSTTLFDEHFYTPPVDGDDTADPT